jgi:predicted ATP-dependent protease
MNMSITGTVNCGGGVSEKVEMNNKNNNIKKLIIKKGKIGLSSGL